MIYLPAATIRQLQQGTPDEWVRRVAQPVADAVLETFFRGVDCPDLREDLRQSAVIAVWQVQRTADPKRNLFCYITTVARHAMCKVCRRQHRAELLDSMVADHLGHELMEHLGDDECDPEES